MLTIDTTFRKDRVLPIGVGYDQRPRNTRPSAIIIHTTNGNAGSTFAGEAKFLRDSRSVSAHFLVGKAGQIAEIVPVEFRAWHAGTAILGFGNTPTIGIELHHAIGDEWPEVQREALAQLVRQLMRDWAIEPKMIERHRHVALPPGRKVDPSDWSDAEFMAWRGRFLEREATLRTYRVIVELANTREGPGMRFPVALGGHAVSRFGHTFLADKVVQGDEIGGTSDWVHRADGIGFLHASLVQPVS